MAWEKVAHDLAAAAGVVVPRTRLLDLAGRAVLLLDRFDRRPTGQRIGYVSAMTMLEANDGERRSYLEIAELVERCSDRASEELAQLWRRVVFSVLISNTDDHLRNHGFLHRRRDVWRLAPAFDMNPSPEPGPSYLSTAIDDADGPASIAAVLGVADLFRLDREQARGIVRDMAVAVGGWRDVAGGVGLRPAEVQRMAPAFSALDEVAEL